LNRLNNQYAELLLKIIFFEDKFDTFNEFLMNEISLELFQKIAVKNICLIRGMEALKNKSDYIISNNFLDTVSDEKKRITKAVELISRIASECEKNDIQYVFPKAFQHYPDMGHDIDLYVHERSPRVDELLKKKLGAVADKTSRSPANRIAGKTGYLIPGYSTPVEIHHGRMGILGEHNIFPDLVIKNRVRCFIDNSNIFSPCPEDMLIIQALQRMYGHFNIRVSDAVASFQIILKSKLDWDYIQKTASQAGIMQGIKCYLSYLYQIYQSNFNKNMRLPEKVQSEFISEKWGNITFGARNYQFPLIPNLLSLFGSKYLHDMLSRNYEGPVRLTLLPLVAIYVAGRNSINKIYH